MDCQSIMTTPPTHLRADTSVDEAILSLLENHMYTMPVTDENDILVGEVSVSKLTELLLPASLNVDRGLKRMRFVRETLGELRGRLDGVKKRPIGDFVDHKVAFVYPDSPIIDALLLLKNGAIRVPVVEPGTRRLVGAISFLTILRAVEGIEADFPEGFDTDDVTDTQKNIHWGSMEGGKPPRGGTGRWRRRRKKGGDDDA